MNHKILYQKILLAGAALLLLLCGCTQIDYTYGVVGTPAISNDGKYVAVLVAESKGISKQVNGGYRSTDHKTAYWLKLYETATGKFIKKKKIINAAEENNTLPICYGAFDDKIWLHSYGLTAYSITTLDEVVDEKKIASQSGFDINNFPDEARLMNVMVADGNIRFTANDGNKYRINLGTLKIQSEKEAPVNALEKIKEQLSIQMALRPTYGKRTDTADNRIWILAKDSTAAIGTNPGNADEERVYKRLYLFSANYTTSNVGSHKFYRNNNLTRIAGLGYINGIFLKDFSSNEIVRTQKSGSYIILHNDSLYNEANSILTAVDENNKKIWQLNTGLSNRLNNCTAKANYLVLAGNKHYLVGPHIGSNRLCIVNTISGKMVVASIAE